MKFLHIETQPDDYPAYSIVEADSQEEVNEEYSGNFTIGIFPINEELKQLFKKL